MCARVCPGFGRVCMCVVGRVCPDTDSESAQFKPLPRGAIRRRGDEKADFLGISMISENTKSIRVLVRPPLIALNCQKMAESNRKCWRLREWFVQEEIARAIDTALETIIGLSKRKQFKYHRGEGLFALDFHTGQHTHTHTHWHTHTPPFRTLHFIDSGIKRDSGLHHYQQGRSWTPHSLQHMVIKPEGEEGTLLCFHLFIYLLTSLLTFNLIYIHIHSFIYSCMSKVEEVSLAMTSESWALVLSL